MNYHILINDLIGPGNLSAHYVERQLTEALDSGAERIDVYINSLGGDVAEALKIRQLLRDCPVETTAYIFGLTASAATIVMTGCKRVLISRFALMLLHRSSIEHFDFGQYNRDELARLAKELNSTADALERIDDLMAAIYADFARKTPADMLALMDEAHWLIPEECLQQGLANDLIEATDDYTKANPADTAEARLKICASLGYPSPVAKKEEEPAANAGSAGVPARNPETPETPENPETPESPASPEISRLRAENATLAADNLHLAQRIDELQATIEALQSAPAADTLAIEGTPADDTPAARDQALRETIALVQGII